MRTKAIPLGLLLTSLSVLAAGCGNPRQGASDSVVRITALEGAPGNKPDVFGGNLLSDVLTIVKVNNVDTATIFNDLGRVTMALALKDPGAPGIPNTPSPLNIVTFTHYRVVYRRTDGRNVEGVDVPYGFDSGLTFSVPADGSVQASFQLVRNAAKQEAPLKGLAISGTLISTIVDVTFYGKDQAGNALAVTGSIGVDFGNFADPSS